MSHPDTAITLDAADIGAGMHARDTIKWWPRVLVEKYDDEQAAWVARKAGVKLPHVNGDLLSRFLQPYDTAEAEGNLLTTAGLDRLTKLYIASGATQALTNTSGRIGVGNSATAAAIGQTDLSASAGSANRWFQIMDATYPLQANGVITVKSSWATGDGNFVWNEWCIDIGAPTVASSNAVAANMLNRAVASLGTKVSGIWVLTATVTIS
jgi:hypothetical protein